LPGIADPASLQTFEGNLDSDTSVDLPPHGFIAALPDARIPTLDNLDDFGGHMQRL